MKNQSAHQVVNDIRMMTAAFVELYFDRIPMLRKKVTTCPVNEVIETRLTLLATLMSARDLASSIADASMADTQVRCFWLLERKLNDELLRMTTVRKSAAVGRG